MIGSFYRKMTLELAEEWIRATGRPPELLRHAIGVGYELEATTLSEGDFYYVLLRGVEYADRYARVQARKARNAKKYIPAGAVDCTRCGGVSGRDGWPGWVCYGCGGRGRVETDD